MRRPVHRRQVMAVDIDRMAAESPDARRQRLNGHHTVHRAVALLAVDVDNHPDRIQAVKGQGLNRFPGLPS